MYGVPAGKVVKSNLKKAYKKKGAMAEMGNMKK
jgi:hypothetical protein